MADGLAFEAVTAGYGSRIALREVSLAVGAGEIVGLIGPNGSGKTTLVRVASRALRPRSGRVLVRGIDPYGIASRQAARLTAVVPQEVATAFEFTVREVVLMGRTPYLRTLGGGGAEDVRRVEEAMRAVGAERLADRPLSELSGGEKQRVILAQALAQDAPVLLLDEPTSHLDLRHQVEILDTLRELASEGRAVTCVFHDLNVAAAACDRLVALDAGRVAASGRPEDVITSAFLTEVYGVEAEIGRNALTGRPSVSLAVGTRRVERAR